MNVEEARALNKKDKTSCLASLLALVVLVITSVRGYLVADEVALHAATASGYTDAVVTNRHNIWPGLFGCDGKDAAGFTVTATNSQKQRVELLVCSGLFFKAATVRIP
jgi:hypothetical protein